MCKLTFESGEVVLLDREDWDRLFKFRWHLVRGVRKNGIPYKTYASRKVLNGAGRQTTAYLHHDILPKKKGFLVDHKDGNTLDCRKSNLRYVTPLQNNANRAKGNKNPSSKYKGVHWCSGWGKWRAQIMLHGKTTMLGGFDSEQDAARAYDKAAKERFGEFARTNF